MPLLNLTNTKRKALHYSQTMRSGKFTRVSKEFLDELERMVGRAIQNKVHMHSSKGKTLMGGQS